jgi:hypothetical protein
LLVVINYQYKYSAMLNIQLALILEREDSERLSGEYAIKEAGRSLLSVF